MKKSVKIFSPASSANLGCGYDSIGLALEGIGDTLEIRRNDFQKIQIFNQSKVNIPLDVNKNIASIVIKKMLLHLSIKDGFDIIFHKKINPCSGIGSSSASAVAAAFGLDILLESKLSKLELTHFATLGEEAVNGSYHADNTAPSMFGGVQFISGISPLQIQNLPYPDDLICIIIFPNIQINTKEARKILPKKVEFRELLTQSRNLGLMINGFHTKNLKQIGQSMNNSLVDSYRMKKIPSFDNIKNIALQKDALGICISGSGPSILVIIDNLKKANEITKLCSDIYNKLRINYKFYITKIDKIGAREIN